MTDSRNDVVPNTLDIHTESGKHYVLHDPSMLDIGEGERILSEEFGRDMPFFGWFASTEGVHIRIFGTAMWLGARKHGLTQEEIEAKKWPFSREQFMDSLSLGDCYKYLRKVAQFFTPSDSVVADLAETSTEQSESE